MTLSRLFAVPVLAVLLLLSAGLPAARAADVPACFCYVNDKGAMKTDGPTDAKKCGTKCATKYGDSLAGAFWAENYSSYPGANLRCWEKKTDCESNLDGDSAGTIDGAWARSQPAECLPKSSYCYSADTSPTYLNVSIAGKRQIINFAEYISVVYNYLMGFAMTVAIVFLMVGGVRYVLGGVSEKAIKGAKDMMTKSVEGFVLLMFAYVILYTVNPQLIKLQVPKMPMLRQVTIMDGNDCGTILGLENGAKPGDVKTALSVNASDTYGSNAKATTDGAALRYEGEPVCGTTAEVLAGMGGLPVADGKTCNFSYCADSKGCAVISGKGQCMACEAITDTNTLGITPSNDVCTAIKYPETQFSGTIIPSALCVYSNDLDLSTTGGSCAKAVIDCSGFTKCGDYGSIKMSNDNENGCAGSAANSSNAEEWSRRLNGGGFELSDVCETDYCHVAPSGETCRTLQLPGTLPSYTCVNSSAYYDTDSKSSTYGKIVGSKHKDGTSFALGDMVSFWATWLSCAVQ